MTTMVDIYDKAIEIVKKGWCQLTTAVDSGNERVSVYTDEARRFCMGGSLYRAFYELTGTHESELLSQTYEHLDHTVIKETANYYSSLTVFNDDSLRVVEDVVAMLEKAKAAAGS